MFFSSLFTLLLTVILFQQPLYAQSFILISKTSPIEKTPILLNLEDFNSNKPYVFEAHWESSLFSNQHEIKQIVRYDNKTSGIIAVDYDTQKPLEEKITAGNALGNIRFVLSAQNIAVGGSKTSTSAGSEGKRTLYLWMGDTSYIGKEDETEFTNFIQWEIEYDLDPPNAMYKPLAIAGDERISLSWKKHSSADVTRYVVYWKKDSTSVSKQSYTKRETTSSMAYDIISGLTNNTTVAIAISAIDEVGNEGELSETVLAVPRSVYDFWELYQSQGGSEDGGYCFIATAAFQDYTHPSVVTLRVFRDAILKQSEIGRTLIQIYYQHGKTLGEYIAGHSFLQKITRFILLSLSIPLRFFLFHPSLFLIMVLSMILIVFSLYYRKLWKNAFRVSLFLSILSFDLPSWAEIASQLSQTNTSTVSKKDFSISEEMQKKNPSYTPLIIWPNRSIDRDENSRKRWAFETKVTKYHLPIDQEQGISAIDDIFHDNANWFFTCGLEYQFWRSFGVLGFGIETGFYQFIGKGVYTDSLTISKDSTFFNGIPIFSSLIYRFDYMSQNWAIPLVPFFKAGFNYQLWWILNGKKEIAVFTGENSELLIARGGSIGVHESVGIELSLNFFDKASATNFWMNVGVSNTYFTLEYQMIQNPIHSQQGFEFHSNELFAGILFEF